MALRTESREIDGLLITVTQFPALKALGLATRVAQAIAPALVNGVVPTSGVALLFAGMDAEQTVKLSTDMLAGSTARVDGREFALIGQAAIDEVFSGRLPTLLKAVMYAVEQNFSDFFDELRSGGDDPAGPRPASG